MSNKIIISVIILVVIGLVAYFIFFNYSKTDLPNEENPRYNSDMEFTFRKIVENELSKSESTNYELSLDKLFVANFYNEDKSLYKTQGYILFKTNKELGDEDFDKLEVIINNLSKEIKKSYPEEYSLDTLSWVNFEIKSPNNPPAGWELSKGKVEFNGFRI